MSSFTGSTRNQRAGLSTVLGATRKYQSLFGSASTLRLLAARLAPQSLISLRQSPRLNNGSDVVLLRSNGSKAGS